MSTLGSNTKTALTRVVETLPYLKAEGNSVPTALRAAIEAIRRDAAQHAGGPRDVQIEAAERWATLQIEQALVADAAPGLGGATASVAAAEPLTGVSIVHGSVSTAPDTLAEKPLAELTDAELDQLTSPGAEQKEGV